MIYDVDLNTPCKECGGHGVISTQYDADGKPIGYRCECIKCAYMTGWKDTEREAIEKWNGPRTADRMFSDAGYVESLMFETGDCTVYEYDNDMGLHIRIRCKTNEISVKKIDDDKITDRFTKEEIGAISKLIAEWEAKKR